MATDLQDKHVAPDADANDPYNREFAALTNADYLNQDGIPGDYGNGGRSGFYNPSGDVADSDSTSLTPSEVKAAETKKNTANEAGITMGAAGAAEAASLFTGGADTPVSGLFRGRISKRKGIAGGILGLVAGGGIFFTLGIASGPLQLIHYAQLLGKPSQHQQSASASEISKLMRWSKTKDIGETRLGFLGSKMNAKIVRDFAAKGITVKVDALTGQMNAFEIETKNSQYSNLSPEEAKAAIAADNGIDQSRIKKGVSLVRDSTRYIVDVKDIKTSGKRSIIRGFVEDKNLGKIAEFVRFRTMAKRLNLPNMFHPLRNAARAADQRLADKIRARNAAKEEKGRLAKLIEPSDATKARIAAWREKTSGLTKGAGASLIATAVLCTVKEIAHDVPEINRVNVVVPAMKSSGDALGIGSQIMSGQDINSQQVGAVVGNFTDSKGTTPWQSAGIQRLEGNQNPSGGAIDPSVGQAFAPNSSAADLEAKLNSLGAGTLCSTAGQFLQVVVGGALLLTGVGGLAEKSIQVATGVAVGYLLSDIVKGITGALTADPLGGLPHQGIAGGNADALGAVELANSNNRGMGGVQLSQKQTNELASAQSAQDNAAFQSEGLIGRIFNVKDYRSLAGHVIDSQNLNKTQTMANALSSVLTGFTHVGSSLTGTLSAVMPHVNAASTSTGVYGLGIPEYGFSTEDLNSSLVSNPYDNADYVATRLLDTNASDTHGMSYQEKATKCFNVNLEKDSNGHWGASVPTDPNGEGGVNPNSESYISAHCDDSSSTDPNWLRVRFFVFDTGTMEGYACYALNDDQSCTNDGFGSSSATIVSPVTNTGTYKDPLRGIKNLVPERIDGGVDYNGDAGPIYAVGNGKVIGVRSRSIESGWPGNPGSYILYQLTDGPAAGKYIYMAEDCSPTVTANQTLTPDTVICNYNYAGTAMEMGWSDGNYNYATNDYNNHGGGSYASNSGQDFSKFLVSLHAPAGKIEGTKSTVPMPAGWPVWQ